MEEIKSPQAFRKEIISALNEKTKRILTSPYKKYKYNKTEGLLSEIDKFRKNFYIEINNSFCSRVKSEIERGFSKPFGTEEINKRIEKEKEKIISWIKKRSLELEKKYKTEVKKELKK